MTKVIRGVLLSVILVIMGSAAVLADNTREYPIDEIGVKIYVPDDLMAYTRTSGIDKNVEKALGVTDDYKEHLISEMEEKNIYFRGFDANVSYEITLESEPNDGGAYSQKSDEEILQIISDGLNDKINGMGTETTSKDVFSENDRKFAVAEFQNNTSDSFVYATVENNQAYYFYIRVLNGNLTDAHKALIKQIAGSVEFSDKFVKTKTDNGVVSDNKEIKNTAGGLGFIAGIVGAAKKIFMIILIVVVVLLVIKMFSGKKIGRDTTFTTKKDAVFRDRLNRVMDVNTAFIKSGAENMEVEEAKLPEDDDTDADIYIMPDKFVVENKDDNEE